MVSLEKIQDYNYEGQRLLFEKSKRLDYDRFTILLIDEFNDDYLNLAINIKAQNAKEFEEDYIRIKEIMNKHNRKTSVFINNDVLLSTVDFKSKGLEISDSSVWLMRDNLKDFIKYEKDIEIDISKISKEEETEYPLLVENGFKKNSKEDPYDGLSQSVIDAIKRSCYTNNEFTTEHYVARYNKKIVGTITIMYEKEIAYIYNVTTDVNYRRKGVCKQLMSHIFNRLIEIGIDEVVLQTESGFYPEKIYKKMGFKEIFKGIKYTEK
ncbi:MAG: GNAT family N-acetyltransferase [Clostridia bacterium]|nr:GNAT family N-acetyltransferase [Clostridia bacterium]